MLLSIRRSVWIAVSCFAAATAPIVRAEVTGGPGGDVTTVCADIVSFNPIYQTNGPYTCTCSFVGIGLDSVSCQDSIDTIPAHSHCSGSSTIVDCRPFGVVQVMNQKYKCKCEITGPDITIGGVTIGLGIVNAKCEPDGAPTPNGTHPTAVALECE